MIQHDFSEYAALWREQIDPEELTELQAMATKIKRTAGRRWLLERLAVLVFAVMLGEALLRWQASPPLKLGMALLLLGPIWGLWKRHQLTKAARAIAVDDPRLFFEAAIENVQAEIKYYVISCWLTIVTITIFCLLVAAAGGLDYMYTNFINMFTLTSLKLTLVGALLILGNIHFFRENLKRREQVRRLEAMRREWAERDPGEEP
jgi:hypothetical protein